jgi:hypothetical protein
MDSSGGSGAATCTTLHSIRAAGDRRLAMMVMMRLTG